MLINIHSKKKKKKNKGKGEKTRKITITHKKENTTDMPMPLFAFLIDHSFFIYSFLLYLFCLECSKKEILIDCSLLKSLWCSLKFRVIS